MGLQHLFIYLFKFKLLIDLWAISCSELGSGYTSEFTGRAVWLNLLLWTSLSWEEIFSNGRLFYMCEMKIGKGISWSSVDGWGQAVIPDMGDVNNMFPVLLVCQKEELAFVFEMLQQFEDALVQYDELDALFSQYVVNFGAGGKCLKMWNKCWVHEFLHCAEQPCALGSHREAAPGSLCSCFVLCANRKCPSVTKILFLVSEA